MNDQLAERIAVALEQIALELVVLNSLYKHIANEPTPQSSFTPQGPIAAPIRVTPEGTFAPLDTWVCPVHGGRKVVPAGVSARTGQPYNAFVACAERGCNEKPPRAAQAAPARAVPPSQGVQGAVLP